MIKLSNILNEESPCWKGYRQIGMKTKNGREVPNCVPINDSIEESKSSDAFTLHILGGKQIGTGPASEFLSKHNVDLKKLQKAKMQGVIDEFEIRDVVNGKAHKFITKKFFKNFVKESVNEAHYTVVANLGGGRKRKENLDNDDELGKFMYDMEKKNAISVDVTKFAPGKKQTIIYDWNGDKWVIKKKGSVKRESVNEAFTKGTVYGGNLKIDGKKVPVEVVLQGADNKKNAFIVKVLHIDKQYYSKLPKDGILHIPAKIFRAPGGGWYKVKVPKAFEELSEISIDKASQNYFKMQNVVDGLQSNQKTLYHAYKEAQKRKDGEYMKKSLESMKQNQQKLDRARKELQRAEKDYFSSVSSTHRSLELDYED